MAEIKSAKKNTKDLILEAAFSFYLQPQFEDFSMSQLAEKVGISKPAIYRHFKSKDELVVQMRSRFFDVLAEKVKDIQYANFFDGTSTFKKQFAQLIVFFAENTQYINYFIRQHTQTQNFEKIIYEELKERGVKNSIKDFFDSKGFKTQLKRWSHIYFCGVSVLLYIKIRQIYFENNNKEICSTDVFANKIIDFLYKGIVGTIGENERITKISEERLQELDRYCQLKPEDLPEEDKIFTAFAKVIRKYGMNGVTIEHIADELGMAKSSLYFYFENKNEMLLTLVNKELSFLKTACAENSVEAKSYTEFIYINMKTETSYFAVRESILAICGWLLQSTSDKPYCEDENKKECMQANSIWEKRTVEDFKKIDFDFPLLPENFTFVAGILPVSLMVLRRTKGLTLEETFKAMRHLFDFAMYGVNA